MATSTIACLGLDIAKAKFDAALLQDGRPHHRQFANTTAGFTALLGWLRARATLQVHACMEATGCYGEALALFLHQQGLQVSVDNPARIKAYARSELLRNKTDRLAAALIARFCMAQRPQLWSPPPLELRQLQALSRRLAALQTMRQQERNRLDLETAESLLRPSLEQHIAHLDQQIAALQVQQQAHVQTHATQARGVELLQSIPGIGLATAIVLLAEIPLLGQYRSARQAAAYAGLSPCVRTSGTWKGKTRLSKVGNAVARKALYFPAITAARANPLLRGFAQRLLSAGKPKMLVIAALMRKLLHQAHGVLKHGKPFDPHYAPAA